MKQQDHEPTSVTHQPSIESTPAGDVPTLEILSEEQGGTVTPDTDDADATGDADTSDSDTED